MWEFLLPVSSRCFSNVYEPVYVEAKGEALDPAETSLVSTQGLVFRIHQNSRIVVEKQGQLPKERKPVFQWRPAPTAEKEKADLPKSAQPKPASRKTKAKK